MLKNMMINAVQMIFPKEENTPDAARKKVLIETDLDQEAMTESIIDPKEIKIINTCISFIFCVL